MKMAAKKSAKSGKRSLEKTKKLVHTKPLAIDTFMKISEPPGS
jgi:hypothetical protein